MHRVDDGETAKWARPPLPTAHDDTRTAAAMAPASVTRLPVPVRDGRGCRLDATIDHRPDVAYQREYHRDRMVAFRQRKKQSLASMKQLHRQLETQLRHQLAVRRAILLSGCPLGLTTLDATAATTNDDQLTPAQRLARFQELYVDLVDVAEVWRTEATRMQAELERLVKLKLLLHHELGLVHLTDEPDLEPLRTKALDGFFVYFEAHEPPFYFEPFTKRECEAATHQGYRSVRALQDAFNRGELGMREVQCFGWRTQRALERTRLENGADGPVIVRVRFTRKVTTPANEAVATMQGFADCAFECISTGDKYAQLLRTRLVCHPLQTIGEPGNETLISLRNAPEPDGSTNVRYLHQLTRVDETFESTEGRTCVRTTILMIAVDSPRHKLLRESMPRDDVMWITEGMAFISFVQLDDVTFEIDYGNVCTCVSDEQAQYFMIELGAQLLRWENLIMPPRLLSFD